MARVSVIDPTDFRSAERDENGTSPGDFCERKRLTVTHSRFIGIARLGSYSAGRSARNSINCASVSSI